jgi:hypothetical protein
VRQDAGAGGEELGGERVGLALPGPEDAQVSAGCPVAHSRADALGNGVE